MIQFGLIPRIALLVIVIEVAAFGVLGGFYTDRFSQAAEEHIRSRLSLVGHLVGREELAVSSVSQPGLMSELVGAPFLWGLVIGGNGRVIVTTRQEFLGRLASEIPVLDGRWLDPATPAEQFIVGKDSLTSVLRINGKSGGSALYTTVIAISTEALGAQKRSIMVWGLATSLLFIVLSSAGILFFAQRFVARRVDASLAVLGQVEKGETGRSHRREQPGRVGAVADRHQRHDRQGGQPA